MAQRLGFATVDVDGPTTRLQMEPRGIFLDLLDHPLDAGPTSDAETMLRSYHEIVFRVRETDDLNPIADDARQLGFVATWHDGAPPYVMINLGEHCDFDFRICAD